MTMASEEAVLERVVFLDHFSDLPDPRQLGKVVYPLDEILLLTDSLKGLVMIGNEPRSITELNMRPATTLRLQPILPASWRRRFNNTGRWRACTG